LVDAKIEAPLFDILADGCGFVRVRDTARSAKGIEVSWHGYGPFTKRQRSATGAKLAIGGIMPVRFRELAGGFRNWLNLRRAARVLAVKPLFMV
jgi:hypothetical protein